MIALLHDDWWRWENEGMIRSQAELVAELEEEHAAYTRAREGEDMAMEPANKMPWWLPAGERPPEHKAIERELVKAGLCNWAGHRAPHPQEFALVALWALRNFRAAPDSSSEPPH